MKASGRWVESEPVEIDEMAAYPQADDAPADKSRLVRRDETMRERQTAALADVTGLDITIPEEFDLTGYGALSAPDEPAVTPDATPDPTAAPEPSTSTWRAKEAAFREARGIRKHTRHSPSKTTPGRRQAYLRSLVKAGKFSTVEEADKATPRRPGATRYGQEVRARRA